LNVNCFAPPGVGNRQREALEVVLAVEPGAFGQRDELDRAVEVGEDLCDPERRLRGGRQAQGQGDEPGEMPKSLKGVHGLRSA